MAAPVSLFDSGIRPTIDEYLHLKSLEVRSYGDYWSASSAGYCLRKNIFERLGVPHVEKEDDARKTRVFESGHIFHNWIQGITKGAGLSVAQELELQDEELMIRGHVDDLVLVAENLILYDIKTAHSRSFHYAKDRPMSHYHKYQLGTYMYMLRGRKALTYSIEGKGIVEYDLTTLSEARILSLSKDDLCMSEKQLLWSDELEAEVLDYWTTLNQYWADKKIPPCSCADHEGGFMATPKYNPYWFNTKPCSIDYYHKWKKETQK